MQKTELWEGTTERPKSIVLPQNCASTSVGSRWPTLPRYEWLQLSHQTWTFSWLFSLSISFIVVRRSSSSLLELVVSVLQFKHKPLSNMTGLRWRNQCFSFWLVNILVVKTLDTTTLHCRISICKVNFVTLLPKKFSASLLDFFFEKLTSLNK